MSYDIIGIILYIVIVFGDLLIPISLLIVVLLIGRSNSVREDSVMYPSSKYGLIFSFIAVVVFKAYLFANGVYETRSTGTAGFEYLVLVVAGLALSAIVFVIVTSIFYVLFSAARTSKNSSHIRK